VALNFGSPKLQEDNLIHQLVNQGFKLLCFGDDTWLRLFPEMFTREDGTVSFFVSDYTEVDQNVTRYSFTINYSSSIPLLIRHLSAELARNDWDLMILHYLGLDHIGHLAGPQSPLVQPKLKEMDDVIESILATLEEKVRHKLSYTINETKNDFMKEFKLNLPPKMLILGDHGMSDSGSHGGASLPETLVPLVLINGQKSDKSGQRITEIPVDTKGIRRRKGR